MRSVLGLALAATVLAVTAPAAEAARCEQRATARAVMVAAAHPAAAAAGCDVLARGGSAADAAVAVQAVLAVVEPQSSGLAGGTLITEYDRSARRVRGYEGLARAPAHVTDGLRTPTDEERAALGVDEFESEALATGRAIGVPGTLRALERAHRRSGKLPWRRLFDRAIALAERGVGMPPYLHDLMGARSQGIARCAYPDLRARYCDGDVPKPVGARIVNAELAAVLREVRDGGADAFYDPDDEIAPAIVARAAAGPYKLRTDAAGPAVIPSLMTARDLDRNVAVERRPVCRRTLGRRLCTTPPPSFGGVTVLQELGLMERGRIDRLRPSSAERVHLSIEAQPAGAVRSPRARRRSGLRPGAGRRAALRRLPRRALRAVLAGARGAPGPARGSAGERVRRERRHDQPCEHRRPPRRRRVDDHHRQLGVRRAHGGARDDPQQRAGELHAARLDLARRARQPDGAGQASAHLDGPSLAFDDRGRLRLVLGAAGGSAIPDYIAQTFLGVTVDGMDPAAAIAQPHWSGQEIASNCQGAVDAYSELEAGTAAAALLGELQVRAHPCARVAELRSGLTAIAVDRHGRLSGAADPRRDGAAYGAG